jgi:predicted transcriptional regulator
MIKPEKLSPFDKKKLRELFALGVSPQNLAKRYGISPSAVSLILSGRR